MRKSRTERLAAIAERGWIAAIAKPMPAKPGAKPTLAKVAWLGKGEALLDEIDKELERRKR